MIYITKLENDLRKGYELSSDVEKVEYLKQ